MEYLVPILIFIFLASKAINALARRVEEQDIEEMIRSKRATEPPRRPVSPVTTNPRQLTRGEVLEQQTAFPKPEPFSERSDEITAERLRRLSEALGLPSGEIPEGPTRSLSQSQSARSVQPPQPPPARMFTPPPPHLPHSQPSMTVTSSGTLLSGTSGNTITAESTEFSLPLSVQAAEQVVEAAVIDMAPSIRLSAHSPTRSQEKTAESTTLLAQLKTPTTLRQAILLREILGTPKGL